MTVAAISARSSAVTSLLIASGPGSAGALKRSVGRPRRPTAQPLSPIAADISMGANFSAISDGAQSLVEAAMLSAA